MKCECGEEATIHWVGEGDYCDECFNEAYSVPLIKSFTKEERERYEKRKKRFQDKDAA